MFVVISMFVLVFASSLALNSSDLSDLAVLKSPDKLRASPSIPSAGNKATIVRKDGPSSDSVGQVGLCARGVRHNLKLAVAYDSSFCARFSNSEPVASAAVQVLVNQAHRHFRDSTCVDIALVYIDANCNRRTDPYAALSELSHVPHSHRAGHILNGFGDFWRSSRTSIDRHAAYLFSGFEDGTPTSGLAIVRGACSASGYGWVEMGSIATFVHELGHTLSAVHADNGIMRASVDTQSIAFSQTSINEITNFVDSADSCLSTVPPVHHASCPGSSTGGQCIARYGDQAGPGVVPCSPLETSFRCIASTTYGSSKFFYASPCPMGFGLVERSPGEGDGSDLFCCAAPADRRSAEVVASSHNLVKLILTYNENRVVFDKHIQDSSAIERRTLLDTVLLPSCRLP